MDIKIFRPTLLVDEYKCKKNISMMADKAKRNNLIFRPHFKTHHSVEIGRWFREAGIDKITVSSMDMATYFAQDGWNDITVAFPVNWLELDKINALSESINLNVLVESIETIDFLTQNLKNEIGVFIKIDTGYHRTGVQSEDEFIIEKLILELQSSGLLIFKGFLVHNGHTYKAKSIKEIEEIHLASLTQLAKLKSNYNKSSSPIIISIGDTPSASLFDNFDGADEIRPGNFIFYDLTQVQLGSCQYRDISVVMACPVVAKHSKRNEIVIYGGGVHFSKESLSIIGNKNIFGLPVQIKNDSWSAPIPDCYLASISQEHGIIKGSNSFINSVNIGDLIIILPIHSCMTADLQNIYLNSRGGIIKNHRS